MKKYPIKVSGMLSVFKKLEDDLFDTIPTLLGMVVEQRINMEDIGEIPARITDYADEDVDGIVKNKILTGLFLDDNKELWAECSDGTTTNDFSIEDMSYVMEYIIEVVEESSVA